MWQKIDVPLPPELEPITTSVWEYPGIMRIGVMRRSFLQPPVVWGQPLKAGVRNLRLAPDLVTEWQYLVEAQTIYAEAELSAARNQALLLYLGFEEIPTEYERKLYQRSI